MQTLVYSFIALASLSLGTAAYFGLTFTPIEAGIISLVAGCLFMLLMERRLRQRAEARLEKGIEELSRLLSTDAQAGAVLGQRINALTDQNAGQRLDGVEADVSVLGTVVRQVAEAVAELEDARRSEPGKLAPVPELRPASVEPEPFSEPVITLPMLRQAMEEDRLVFHTTPIVTLPQRRTYGLDLVPRLRLEGGEFAESAHFMPQRGGEIMLRRIEGTAVHEAITLARRARTANQAANLFVPISRATLNDQVSVDHVLAALDANRAVAGCLHFTLTEADWLERSVAETEALGAIAKKAANLAITEARSLRIDFAALEAQGVRSIRVDATRFIAAPASFTDFHASDIGAYLSRFNIALIATGVRSEQEILALIEDGVGFAQGPHIAKAAPPRDGMRLDRPALVQAARRAEV